MGQIGPKDDNFTHIYDLDLSEKKGHCTHFDYDHSLTLSEVIARLG